MNGTARLGLVFVRICRLAVTICNLYIQMYGKMLSLFSLAVYDDEHEMEHRGCENSGLVNCKITFFGN